MKKKQDAGLKKGKDVYKEQVKGGHVVSKF